MSHYKKTTLIAQILLVVLSSFGCNEPNKENELTTIKAEFKGFWAETEWIYNFEIDGNYTLIYEGHAGNGKKRGKYSIISDKIVTLPESEHFNDYRSRVFGRLNDDCIYDFFGNHYCESIDAFNTQGEIADKRDEEMIKKMKTLPLIKTSTDKILQKDSTKKVSLQFVGLITEKNKIFEEYHLVSRAKLFDRKLIHERLYVRLNSNEIYNQEFIKIKE